MKTFKKFLIALKKQPIYADGFSNREDVFNQFAKPEDKDIKICYAVYIQESYDGNAIVIYYRSSTKKYYEAYGSHCSCYGLDNQWEGNEEIVFEELEKRLIKNEVYGGDTLAARFKDYLKANES